MKIKTPQPKGWGVFFINILVLNMCRLKLLKSRQRRTSKLFIIRCFYATLYGIIE